MIRLFVTEIDLDVIAQNMQIIRKMAKSKEVVSCNQSRCFMVMVL